MNTALPGNPPQRILLTGEFADQTCEQAYADGNLKKTLLFMRRSLLPFGILYLLFNLPDYYLIAAAPTRQYIFANRFIFFGLLVLLFIRLHHIKTYRSYARWITAGELGAFASFLHIYYLYEQPDLLIQTYGLMIILLVVFLVPNRLGHKVLVSLAGSAVFFYLTPRLISPLRPSDFSAAVVYTLIVIGLAVITSYRSECYQRIQYVSALELHRLSITDPLTGICNRLKLEEELGNCLSFALRYGTPLSLILFDLDDFKQINDRFGHLAGDKVLSEFAGLIRPAVRDSDTFARWGGEEFILLLPGTDRDEALPLAHRLQSLIAANNFAHGLRVTCSIGFTSLRPGDDRDALLRRVDALMYRGKAVGKNCVVSA